MKCKICKKEFIRLSGHIIQTHKISSEEYYDKFLKKENEGICPECGKETKFIDLGNGYQKFCSRKCMTNSKEIQEKKKQTCLKNFGVKNPNQSEEIKEKIKQTNSDKYGAEHPFQNKKIKEKYRQTCLKNFGVKNPNQSEEIKEKKKEIYLGKYGGVGFQVPELSEKCKQTCLEKYGVEYYCQTKDFLEKSKQTCLEHFGVDNYSKTEEFRERMKNGQSVYMSSFIKNPSKPQVELFDLVKSLHEETILNFPTKGKSGKCYSLDIAIPSLMVDIEYDGSYWHQNKEQDQKRQEDLEESGWKFLRYRDRIPLLEDLKIDLSCIFGD